MSSCCDNQREESPEDRAIELRTLSTSPRSPSAVMSSPRSPPAVMSDPRSPSSRSRESLGGRSIRPSRSRRSLGSRPSMASLSVVSLGSSRPPLPPLNAYMLGTNQLIRIGATELALMTRGQRDRVPTCKLCQDALNMETDNVAVHNGGGCGAAFHDECFKNWIIDTFHARTRRWTRPYCAQCQETLEVYVRGGAFKKWGE